MGGAVLWRRQWLHRLDRKGRGTRAPICQIRIRHAVDAAGPARGHAALHGLHGAACRCEQDRAATVAAILADNQIGLHAPADLDAILSSLGVDGRALDAGHLLALGSFLASVDVTCASIRRARGACPILRAIGDASATFDAETW